MALMLAPLDLRLFPSKAAHDKRPIIPRHLRTSRHPVRNRFCYRIDTRWIDHRPATGVASTLQAPESSGGAPRKMVFERVIVWPDGRREIEGVTPKALPAPDGDKDQ
jgi:hypothetical protein